MKCISFDEIVQGRDANVRVTDDGYLYAVDLVVVMTEQERNHAAKTLRNLSDAVFSQAQFVDRRLSLRYYNSFYVLET
jgi:hypothetical protein